MISKNEIKLIRSLSLKKYREREGLFIAEGEKLVGEAVSSGCKIRGIYRTDDIGEENMRKITMLSSPSPVLAVVEIPQAKEPQEIGKDKLYIALDNVKDPGNVGTILRIADWFGIEAVYNRKMRAGKAMRQIPLRRRGNIRHFHGRRKHLRQEAAQRGTGDNGKRSRWNIRFRS